MLTSLIAFELRRRARMPSTYLYAALMLSWSLFLVLSHGGLFDGSSAGNEQEAVNSPRSLFSLTTFLTIFGLLTVGAVFGQAAHQDFEHRTWMLVFSTKVRKVPYLLGRFSGAYVFSSLLFLSIAAGQLLGTLILSVAHPVQLAEVRLMAYLWPFLVVVWPTLLFAGALFFCLAALTRRMGPVYVAMLVLALGYLVGRLALPTPQNREPAALLDPFGMIAFIEDTKYWTIAERNRNFPVLADRLLRNRLLFTAAGLGLLALAAAFFRPTVDEHAGRRARQGERSTSEAALPRVSPAPTWLTWVRTALSGAWLSFREVNDSPVYASFIAAGFGAFMIGAGLSDQFYGTSTYPVTYLALESALTTFEPFALMTLTFFAGELVWKERDARVQDIVDTLRVPTWVGWVSKLGALLLIALSLHVAAGVAALATQALNDTSPQWELYAVRLLVIDFSSSVAVCALALLAQVLVNNKYLGHAIMVLYYLANLGLGMLGVEDRLVLYNQVPDIPYSDMNGYGPFLPGWAWYRSYWTALALVLVLVGYLFVVRGRDTAWRTRLQVARSRATGPLRAALALALAAFTALGGAIYYSTHVRNPHVTRRDTQLLQGRYEQEYKSFAALPMPRITGVDVTFHLFPSEHRLQAVGVYQLKNKTPSPVSQVLVSLDSTATVRRLSVAGVERASKHDAPLGLFLFELPVPLQPGAEAELAFDMELAPNGLQSRSPRTDIVENGTFFNNLGLPRIGYDDQGELAEDKDRKRYGLPPKERMADRDDAAALQNHYLRKDSDFVTFRATISTAADQLALAPGYLEREWTEGSRRYFQYAMDRPIINFYSILSARYAMKRDTWRDVRLEVYHHPTHTYNLERMMQGMKDALEYCSTHFGPYPHRQLRIVEFPRYGRFAQSFPNTIPYSEAFGFIAQVEDKDPNDIDYPYYVTAHEVAHQWWGHQVVGGNVQGATMTSETLSQYVALMVMKHRYGPETMRRFLKFELDRYLQGRGTESKKEVPLSRVEEQDYIYYKKGSLAMYALQDLVGEERVNRALGRYIEKVRYQGPPYTNSTELLGFLRQETPAEYQYLLEDLFETMTLYDNRAVWAKVKQNAAGGYDVTLKVVSAKYRSDESGNQTELDFNDWMDIGALDDKGKALFLEKRRVGRGESELTFSLPVRPATVGVDPLNKLIDRISRDNVTAAKEQ